MTDDQRGTRLGRMSVLARLETQLYERRGTGGFIEIRIDDLSTMMCVLESLSDYRRVKRAGKDGKDEMHQLNMFIDVLGEPAQDIPRTYPRNLKP